MIEAFAIADVYAAEKAVMAGLPEGALMARAVAGLVEVAAARLDALGGSSVVALVGPGNNGADALYAVAGLAALGVNAAAVHRPDAVHAGARKAAGKAGVVLVADDGSAAAAASVRTLVGEADLVLDGIVGIGGRPGLPEFARGWVEAIGDGAFVLAVDLPSGQDPAGEQADPDGVWADETVTFSMLKPVHLMPATEAACGRLTVMEIGVAPEAAPVVRRCGHDDVAGVWPRPGAGDDKYSRGVVGVLAGSEKYTGAAVLAVTAAAEAGAGMVRHVGPPAAEALVRAAVPEAVPGEGRVQAWVVGPGLDAAARGARDRAVLAAARAVLGSADGPVLVDAGGLDLLEPGWRRSAPTLLTPHAGECARLLDRLGAAEVTRAEVEAAPVAAARRLADLTSCSVLLKGSTTVVVGAPGAGLAPGALSPGIAPEVWTQADAPPWLATAGAGDVLSGIIGVLLAGGLEPVLAGAVGALVHGVAAERANPGGPVRALAVAHALPGTIAALLTR